MQIAVSEFTDNPLSLTFERISTDLPDLVIENGQSVPTNFGSIILYFDANDQSLLTHEAWFAFSGYLYQISILRESASVSYRDLIEEVGRSVGFEGVINRGF